MSITSFLVRSSFGKNDRKRDAGLKTPDTIERFDDISYGPDRKWQILDEYGFDTGNIFAAGDSAGACLLALYCCIHTNPDYTRNYSFSAPVCPEAVLLNCGLYHQEYTKKKNLTALLMANLMPGRGTEEEYRLLYVDEHTTSSFPP